VHVPPASLLIEHDGMALVEGAALTVLTTEPHTCHEAHDVKAELNAECEMLQTMQLPASLCWRQMQVTDRMVQLLLSSAQPTCQRL
jgi:hypothetical protein